MHNINFARIFIVCLLAVLLSGVSLQAAAFGVTVSPSRNSHNTCLLYTSDAADDL